MGSTTLTFHGSAQDRRVEALLFDTVVFMERDLMVSATLVRES